MQLIWLKIAQKNNLLDCWQKFSLGIKISLTNSLLNVRLASCHESKSGKDRLMNSSWQPKQQVYQSIKLLIFRQCFLTSGLRHSFGLMALVIVLATKYYHVCEETNISIQMLIFTPSTQRL